VYVLSYSSKVIGLFKDLLSPLYIYDLEVDISQEFNDTGIADFMMKVSTDSLNYDLEDLAELKNKSLANLRLVNDFIECSD
jgi:hypothetical protein